MRPPSQHVLGLGDAALGAVGVERHHVAVAVERHEEVGQCPRSGKRAHCRTEIPKRISAAALLVQNGQRHAPAWLTAAVLAREFVDAPVKGFAQSVVAAREREIFAGVDGPEQPFRQSHFQ